MLGYFSIFRAYMQLGGGVICSKIDFYEIMMNYTIENGFHRRHSTLNARTRRTSMQSKPKWTIDPKNGSRGEFFLTQRRREAENAEKNWLLQVFSGDSDRRAFGRHTKTHRVAESLRD